MNEAQLFEMLGRKQARIEGMDASYDALLALLADVVSGRCAPSRVLVNLTDRSWERAPEGHRPGLPATVNGLPKVVVAPEEAPPPVRVLNGDEVNDLLAARSAGPQGGTPVED